MPFANYRVRSKDGQIAALQNLLDALKHSPPGIYLEPPYPNIHADAVGLKVFYHRNILGDLIIGFLTSNAVYDKLSEIRDNSFIGEMLSHNLAGMMSTHVGNWVIIYLVEGDVVVLLNSDTSGRGRRLLVRGSGSAWLLFSGRDHR